MTVTAEARVSGRTTARLLLVLFVGLILWGALAGSQVPDGFVQHTDAKTDAGLYRAIAHRVADGDNYYAVVAVEQPARGFPTSPAMTVREPTLAWLAGALSPRGAYVLLLVLAGVALTLTLMCFDTLARSRLEWVLGSVIASATIANLCLPANMWSHDVWAGMLIYIGALASTRKWFVIAMLSMLAACLIRELALPAAVAVGAMSWSAGGRRTRAAWGAALLGFAVFYLWHVHEVGQIPTSPVTSPGWVAFHGWPFVVNATWFSTLLSNWPVLVAAIVTPCALLGWIMHASVHARAVAMVLVVYVVAFSVIGRSNNLYWGALFGALLLPGLAFAPRALVTLIRSSATDRPRSDP